MNRIDAYGFGFYSQKQFIKALDDKAEELSIGEVAFMLREASQRLQTAAQAFRGEIEKLPPVTQKSGKWIEHEIEDTLRWVTCSKCNCEMHKKFNYCPNCGAEMESEE